MVVFPCVTGSENNHSQLEALRAIPGLVEDGVRRHSFIAQQSLFGTGYGVDRHYWKGHFVRELPDELIDELVRRISALGRPPGGILFESLHGAPKGADVPPGAIGYRHAAFNISATATWRDPALDDQHVAWSRETAAAIEAWSWSGGGYANYMQADEPIERVRAMFADGAFDRLQALKRRYDPDNLLRRNQNIPPPVVDRESRGAGSGSIVMASRGGWGAGGGGDRPSESVARNHEWIDASRRRV